MEKMKNVKMKECAWWEMGSDYMYTEERGDGWGSDAVKHYMSVHHELMYGARGR